MMKMFSGNGLGKTDALGQRHEGNEGNVSRSLMFEKQKPSKNDFQTAFCLLPCLRIISKQIDAPFLEFPNS